MANTSASSIAILDNITAKVESLSVAAPAAAARGGLPTETKDVRWWPIIPAGHTAYTFYGVDAANPSGVAAPVKAAKAPAAAAAATPAAASSSPAPAAAAADKKEKAAKPAKAAAPKAAAKPAAEVEDMNQIDFTKLDIRVGQIVKADRHPKPEVTSLYVEEIDVGDEQPRQIVSGLVKYIPLDVFSTARCLVICNLKPSPLQGVTSNGMVLAASTGEGDARVVELIQPPAGSKPGDRIVLLDSVDYSSMKPMTVVDPRKKNKAGEPDNAWARVAATLKTNGDKQATWNGVLIGTKENGPAAAATLANANIA